MTFFDILKKEFGGHRTSKYSFLIDGEVEVTMNSIT